MTKKKAAAVMDLLSPELVEEAACISYPKRHSPWMALAAACVCILLLGAALTGLPQRLTAVPFQEPHFTEDNENYLIRMSLNRVPAEVFSSDFLRDIQDEEEQALFLYYDSTEEAVATLGYPMLKQTRSHPRYMYFETDSGVTARVQLVVSRNKDMEPAVVYLSACMTMVHMTEKGPVSLSVMESQSIFTEYFRYSELLSGWLQENERLQSTATFTAEDGSAVCVYRTTQYELRLQDRGSVPVQEQWNVVFQKENTVVELQIYPDAGTTVSQQDMLSFIEELVNSYEFTEGGTK